MKPGDRVRVMPGLNRAGGEGTVTRVAPETVRPFEVEFSGPRWFHPCRAWFAECELEELHSATNPTPA